MKKKEIQATQGAYILKQMAVDLKADVEEELMKDYNMKISAIDVAVKNEENQAWKICKISTFLWKRQKGKKTLR